MKRSAKSGVGLMERKRGMIKEKNKWKEIDEGEKRTKNKNRKREGRRMKNERMMKDELPETDSRVQQNILSLAEKTSYHFVLMD